MLSPLSAVQSNTRVTRSRMKTGTTPSSVAKKLAVDQTPAKASPSPAAATRTVPQTPCTPSVRLPGPPPPTPASPMAVEMGSAQAFDTSLDTALTSFLAAVPELARAMEDLIVDPTSELPTFAIAPDKPGVSAAVPAEHIDDGMHDENDEASADGADEPDDASEDTEAGDDGMGVTHRMRMHGMLPDGTPLHAVRAERWRTPSARAEPCAPLTLAHLSTSRPQPRRTSCAAVVFLEAAPEGPSHVRFEPVNTDTTRAFGRVDASRAHGLFPASALAANACSASHIRFPDDE